ncbi:GAF domain-containing protein [Pseudonocardia sp. RS010]|uniref:GAF domain-containing protein n=1 Tax=Pseudonocardia sp. RS010 TaxID=3385979 RepID=UPI00399FF554
MHPDDPGIMGLTLQVGRTAVAGADLGSLLSAVCTALPATLGVSGAAIVLVDVPDSRLAGIAGVSASDPAAGRLGEMEVRAGTGPVQGAVRSGRPMVTPDLTRIGPPELAAAAADTGLTCSVVVPLVVDGEPVGGLQLFGHPGRPVGDGHVDAVAGLAEALSARITDVCALRRLTATVARLTAEHEAALPVAHATGMLAERYRTDVEEAGRYLASRARKAGVDPAAAGRSVLDRTDEPAATGTETAAEHTAGAPEENAAGEDAPTQAFGVVPPAGSGARAGAATGPDGPGPGGRRARDPQAAPAERQGLPSGAVPAQRRGAEGERSRSAGGRRRLVDDRSAAGGAHRADPHATARPVQPAAERSRGSRSDPRAPQADVPRSAPGQDGAGGPSRGPEQSAPGPGPVPPGALPAPRPRHGADPASADGSSPGGPSTGRPSGTGSHRRADAPGAPASGGGKRRLREPADRLPQAGEALGGRDPWDLDQAALDGAEPLPSGGRRRAEDRPDAARVPQQRANGRRGGGQGRDERDRAERGGAQRGGGQHGPAPQSRAEQGGDGRSPEGRPGDRQRAERSGSGRRAAPPTGGAPPIPGSGGPRARHRRADIT